MKRIISFQNNAFDEYSNWATKDKKIFTKIIKLIKDIQRNPFDGIGSPEALKHQKSGLWSRHINLEHRLVYEITEDKIIIYSCYGHYN